MRKLLIVLLLLTFNCAGDQSFDKAKLDSFFSILEENGKGMGSISIFENGTEVYQKAFGFASIEDNVKASEKTKYRIGSITKTFTATVIMRLVEMEKLTLETTLDKFYPQVENASKITIEQLLRHRSGIFNFTNAPDYVTWMEIPHSHDELLQKIIKNGSIFQPDSKAEYSNSNYILLSFIAEKVSGKNYDALVKELIVEPLGLKNTYYGGKISVKNNEAKAYQKISDWQPSSETDMSIPYGAGAIVSNPTDLNTFFSALFAGKIVSETSLEKMTTLVDKYGMGLFEVPFYDKSALGHNGAIDHFQSNAYFFPIEKVSVAYTGNGVVMPVNDIMIGTLSIYFGRDYELPVFTEGLKLTTEELDKYLGTYSAPNFPLKITISKDANVLIAQGSGQPSFPLEAYEKDKFKFDQAGLKITFLPNDAKLIIYQGGGEFELTRE